MRTQASRPHFTWRLLLPVVLANLLVALMAYRYLWLTLMELPGEERKFFFTLSVSMSTFVVAMGVGLCARRLRALRGVDSAPKAAGQARLAEAVAEVHRGADVVFFVTLGMWVVGNVLTSSLMVLLERVPFVWMPRLLGSALLFSPLASLLAYCLFTFEARRVMVALVALGLSPSQAIASAHRRSQLRLRLVLFTAITAVTPAILIWDLSSVVARQAFSEMLAQSTPQARAALTEQLRVEVITSGGELSALAFALALAAAWLAGTLLGQPMRELGQEALRSAEGQLGALRLIPAEDEVWDVSAAFTTMRIHLADVLSKLLQAGTQIGSTTEQILATSTRYQQGATEQSLSLDETSATTEEMARSAGQIAENASSVAEIAMRTLSAAQEGQASADAFLATMSRMRHDNQAIATAVARLNKRVQQIGQIVEFIHGVADRADLLALNAELEGTKAGEMGQGFSLVASEMRRLAENVLESTKEIEGLIEEVMDASGGAVTATEGGVRATESGTSLAEEVSEALRQIVEMAGRTSDAVKTISLSTQEQRTSTGMLAEAMADILRITQRSHEATRKVSSIHGGLSTLAHDLRSVVERFHVSMEPPEGGG